MVGLGVTAGAIRRRLGSERSSVRDYHQTLETLRHLSDHRAAVEARVRVSAPVAQAAESPVAAGTRNGRGASGTRRRPKAAPTTLLASSGVTAGRAPVLAERSGPPAVTVPVEEPVEAAPADLRAASEPDGAPPGPRSAHRISAADAVRELVAARNLYGPGPSRSTMPPPRRANDRSPFVWTVAAVVVIGVVIGLVLAKAPSHSPSTASSTHRSTTSAHRSAAPPARTPSRSPATSSTRSSSGHGVSNGLDSVTASSTAASYRVPAAPYTLIVNATGPCWIEATNSATGQVLWTGTLHAGDSQTVSASSTVLLRLGDALNVTLAVSGQAVHLPPGFSPTIDLTFLAS